MILKLLLNTRMVWMIFIKTLKNTIQASNKTLNLTVTELFFIWRKNNKSSDKQQKCNINKEAAKILAWLSAKIDKYEYLTGEQILSSEQGRVIEPPKFNYCSLGKTLKK